MSADGISRREVLGLGGLLGGALAFPALVPTEAAAAPAAPAVPTGVGLGIQVDEEKLRQLATAG